MADPPQKAPGRATTPDDEPVWAEKLLEEESSSGKLRQEKPDPATKSSQESPSRVRNNKSTPMKMEDRKAAFYMLLGMCATNEGKLTRGAKLAVGRHFGVSIFTMNVLWNGVCAEARNKQNNLPSELENDENDCNILDMNFNDNTLFERKNKKNSSRAEDEKEQTAVAIRHVPKKQKLSYSNPDGTMNICYSITVPKPEKVIPLKDSKYEGLTMDEKKAAFHMLLGIVLRKRGKTPIGCFKDVGRHFGIKSGTMSALWSDICIEALNKFSEEENDYDNSNTAIPDLLDNSLFENKGRRKIKGKPIGKYDHKKSKELAEDIWKFLRLSQEDDEEEENEDGEVESAAGKDNKGKKQSGKGAKGGKEGGKGVKGKKQSKIDSKGKKESKKDSKEKTQNGKARKEKARPQKALSKSVGRGSRRGRGTKLQDGSNDREEESMDYEYGEDEDDHWGVEPSKARRRLHRAVSKPSGAGLEEDDGESDDHDSESDDKSSEGEHFVLDSDAEVSV